MISHPQTGTVPRWGSLDRPRKAEAIWRTLLHYGGSSIAQGVWVDVGCGNGGIAASLAPRVGYFMGVDPEPWSHWTEWMAKHDNLSFLQAACDSQRCPIAPASADVVICNQVYEHVTNPQALIACLHTILKPGGWCYFAGPNLLFPVEPHVFWPFIHWLPRRLAQGIMRAVGAKHVVDANSVTYWTLQKWLGEFCIANAVPYILRNPREFGRTGMHWWPLARLPQWMLHAMTPLSPGFVFVLRKTASV